MRHDPTTCPACRGDGPMEAFAVTSFRPISPFRGDDRNHSKKRGRAVVKAIAAREGLPMAA